MTPEWSMVQAWADKELAAAATALETVAPEGLSAIQARIKTLREVRALPSTLTPDPSKVVGEPVSYT